MFPRSSAYLRVHDALGPLDSDPQFAALFPKEGQPAVAPARPALATISRFAEGLSGRRAADAVRGRSDREHAPCLPPTDPGFDASVLREFRARLIARGAEAALSGTRLATLKDAGPVEARGRQRRGTRSRVATRVLAAIRGRNRLGLVGEAPRHALHTPAAVAPERLSPWVPTD